MVIGISLPLTTMHFSRASTVPLNRPCTLSYFSKQRQVLGVGQVVDRHDVEVGRAARP